MKGKRAAPAIALNTKNCSMIELARAAQAENNVTIETVKHFGTNRPVRQYDGKTRSN